ncbi:hypothetical protein [Halosegnis sp.]|uniref:hypothetical protein n=1 Tax=Halosegnis sp. TaxID=2864959 RepID=UPI0035D4AB01
MAPPEDPVARLAADETHGSTHLSLRALEALRERARETAEYDDIAAFARRLRAARPSMHAVATRVDRAMAEADQTPASVARSAERVREMAEQADEAAAEHAATRIDGRRVCTLSRSGTVRATLAQAPVERVYVLTSQPGGEGVETAAALDATVTLAADAAVADLFAEEAVDALLVGADTVFPDGSVLNKVGTRTAATVAAHTNAETLVVCAAAKIAPAGTTDADREPRDPTELYDGEADVTVHNPTFDRTPAALVDAVLTEQGALDTARVDRVAEEHAALTWDG